MPISGLEIFIIVAMAAIFFAVLGIRKAREMRNQKTQMMNMLGFYEDTEKAPDIKAKLKALNPRNKRIRFDYVYKYSGGDHQKYIIEYTTHSDDNTPSIGLVIRSQYFNFPRISIIPRIDIKGLGFLGKIINSLITKIISKDLIKIEIEEHSGINEKYQIFGRDAGSVKRVFTEDVIEFLVHSDDKYHLELSEDILLMNRIDLEKIKNIRKMSQQDWREEVDCGTELFKLFRREHYQNSQVL